MEALTPPSDTPAPNGFVALTDPRRAEYLLEALKTALASPGEHRLFRMGKIPGLFPARTGAAGEAALEALRDGLLETTRTEVKGKLITEWVQATPKAVRYVHEHDSLRSLLRELKELLQVTQTGVPQWMTEAKQELAAIAASFEVRATALLTRLEELAQRCDAAIRRAEMNQAPLSVAEPLQRVVPWAAHALDYLDRRRELGLSGSSCPLPELFQALRATVPELTLPAFHQGLKRLHDARLVQLEPAEAIAQPEYAVVCDGRLMYSVHR
ncbi:MAG: hypothetical protein RMJ56_15965 [Gemmataceae bacterium]|nr:hypothetical protein [Gemmata sp.]MDW8199092.1 hypothetical protein [Gemmataceae bacterium]